MHSTFEKLFMGEKQLLGLKADWLYKKLARFLISLEMLYHTLYFNVGL